MWLFFAFLAIPLIEIALFIQVGGLIGLWPTLAVVVITAVLGTWLVRTQGRQAIGNLRNSFERLDDPSEPLAHGAMILIAGALLLTPGFFTDAVGFALLVPGLRHAAFVWAKSRVTVARFDMGSAARPQPQTRADWQDTARPRADDVIGGDSYEVQSDRKPTPPGSGWTRH